MSRYLSSWRANEMAAPVQFSDSGYDGRSSISRPAGDGCPLQVIFNRSYDRAGRLVADRRVEAARTHDGNYLGDL